MDDIKKLESAISKALDETDANIRAMGIPERIRVIFWTMIFSKISSLCSEACYEWAATLPPMKEP